MIIFKQPPKLKLKLNKVIIKEYPQLEDLEITPTTEEQSFKSEKYGYDNVTVKGIETEELNVIPSNEDQIKEGVFNKVTIAGDSNLIPENIKTGVEIFGVSGIVEEKTEDIIMAGNGAPTVEAVAQTNISKYDSVKILINESTEGTEFVHTATIPVTANYQDSKSVSLKFPDAYVQNYLLGYISPTGNFITVGHSGLSSSNSTGEYGAYPFYKIGDNYVQLTIDGKYIPFRTNPNSTSTSPSNVIGTNEMKDMENKNPIFIDETKNIVVTANSYYLAFYELDIENLNLVFKNSIDVKTNDFTTSNANMKNIGYTSTPLLVNNNVFFKALYYVSSNNIYRPMYCQIAIDDDYNLIYETGEAWSYCGISGYSIKGNDVYIAVLTSSDNKYNTSKSKLLKYTLSDGIYSRINEAVLPLQPSTTGTTSPITYGFCLNSTGTKVTLLNSNALHSYVINADLTFTEVTEADFTDTNFDYTNVKWAYISRDGMYIIAEINDSTLSYADRLVMLEYEFGDDGGYKLVGYPIKDFTPAILSSTTTANKTAFVNDVLQFDSYQNMIFRGSDGTSSLIFSAMRNDGMYLMHKSGKVLSSEDNLYGFGIAEKREAIGETGVASLNVVRTI